MKNIFKTLAVAVLMMSAVAAFAQSPTSRPAPAVKHVSTTEYAIRGSKVYYNNVELRDADYRTFKALGYGYAKDKNNVWWYGVVLPYVDAKSFRLTTQSGKPNVTPGPGSTPNVVPGVPGYGPGATPGAAPSMPGYGPGPGPGYAPGYGQGGAHGHGGYEVPIGYEVIGSTVYYNGDKVKGARASSFKDLGWGYAVDTFDVYYCGKEIDASTTNFKVLEDGYAKNSFDVFYLGKEVKGASASSFKVLSNGYAKDSFDTYYNGKKIDD